MTKKIDKTGEQFVSKEGYTFIIVKYNNANDLYVEFQDEHKAIVPTFYQSCQRGSVKNPYHPNKYGGYIGQGGYKSRTKCYDYWFRMLQRCSDKDLKGKEITYEDVIFNKEVLNFQNFGRWFDNNYYEIEGETMELDKDILVKGNKEYRFDVMVFVPQRINLLFTKRDNNRGDLPIGVTCKKETNKYQAQCNTLEGKKHLGYYNTPEEAFLAYKEFKEAYIKQVADEYKRRIPDRLYEAMYAWTVEIDD